MDLIKLIAFLFCIVAFRVHRQAAFTIEPIKLELLDDDAFRLALPNDPDIKWVAYNVNINKPFRAFEAGQLSGVVNRPERREWSYQFDRSLDDNDLVYVWLAIQYNKIIFRDKQGPISVAAVRRGDANIFVSGPVDSAVEDRTTSTTTTTTTTTTAAPSLASGPDKMCFPTVTEVSTGGKFCKGDLLLEDNFDQFLPDRWSNEVYIPLESADAEFVYYNGTATVQDGILNVPARLYASSVIMGSIDLKDRCTSVDAVECSLRPSSSFFLPPVVSGRVSTKNSFNFKYGRIEVRARLPKGDWLVPIIALQPSSNKYGRKVFVNGEMRIAFARGNHELKAGNTNIDGKRLFGGIILKAKANDRHRFMANVTLDEVSGNEEHFGNQFHLYSMIWSPREIILMVDGFQYGLIKTNFKEQISERAWRLGPENAPLDQMYYLTLGLSVGGHGDFPDDSENKPWENTSPRGISTFFDARGQWHPLWERPALEVDYVRIYAV